MNIALIGYGKMGKEIEAIACERGHQVVLKIDINNISDFVLENMQLAQVAIEFTKPETAYDNIIRCIDYNVPVVSGSTGWYNRLDEAKTYCKQHNGSMLSASNFSLGVNIFFKLNQYLAGIMNNFPVYQVEMEEIHHTQKLDAPSGTAITLANDLISELDGKTHWQLNGQDSPDAIPIRAIREDHVPGTHTVKYTSSIDDIELTHTAHSRKGFALGAVLAAEFICNKKGVFTMDDLLNLNTMMK